MKFPKNSLYAGGYIRTYTGKYVNPFNINIEDVDIKDIAHALSMMCRFSGHCKKFFSVAQHSLLVSRNLPQNLKLEGLLHDASEAYLVDIPSPIKQKMPQYLNVENNLMTIISKKFKIDWPTTPEVKKQDKCALEYEWEYNVIANKTEFVAYEPSVAEKIFLDEFNKLYKNQK